MKIFCRSFLAVVACGVIFISILRSEETQPAPRAVSGWMDLTDYDLTQHGPIRLGGEWEFYWDTLIDPLEFPTSDPLQPTYVPVPANWKTYSFLTPPPSLYGKATYRIRVITDGSVYAFGLRLKRIYSAYRLYVNGMLVASNGVVKDSREETEGQLAVKTVYFTSFTPTLDILLQVANPYYYRAGILSPPELGTQEAIVRAHAFALAADVFLLGIIVIMAAYYYIHAYILANHRYSSLFFALFCTVVGLRVLLISGERFLYFLVPQLTLKVDMFIQGFGIYLLIPTFLAFIYFLFPSRGNPRIVRFVGGASLIYLLANMVLPVRFHGYILSAYYPFFVGGLGYMAYIIIYAIFQKDADALLEGFGFLFILFTGAYDMMIDRELYYGDYILPLGLLCFIFIQSVILSRRYSRAFIGLEVLVQENKKILEALESRVQERTADLKRLNDHLEEARKQAEEANNAKTRFLQNMSHEMRTPLNGILGYAELIRDTDPKSIHRSYVAKIIEESKNLLDLINQILDVSKIEAGRLTLESVKFNVQELIQSVYEILLPLAERKSIHFRLVLSPDLPRYVQGDPARLRQVLVNLVGNAIKFTHQGWVELRAELQESRGERVILLFTIQDTGIGISKEFQKNMFNRFTQAQEGLTRSYGGTGLGTTIAKQLTELMGGSISLQSEEGKGTIFWVSIPFQQASEEQLPEKKGELEETRTPELLDKTILVVEDYPTTLQITRHHLESAGARVVSAENGLDGIKALAKTRIDCILMDIQMPQMDGLETTQLIRKLPIGKDIPIIGMTASAYNKDIQSCLDAGMNDVLTKPIRKNDLLQTLHHWLNMNTLSSTASEIESGKYRSFDSVFSSEVSHRSFDPSKLLMELQGDQEEFTLILRGFLQQVDEQIQQIQYALQTENYIALAREAHSLKGGSLTLYALPLAEAAAALEQAARSSRRETLEAHWETLQKELENLKSAITQYLETHA
jgi:signal transduction histidine kinase/DNA-binding response OmpR family regulator